MKASSRSEEAHLRLTDELRAEQAAALRRIGERLAELLRDLEERLGRLAIVSERERALARETARTVAAEARLYRWYMVVQREAVGLRDHRCLDEVYPFPRGTDL